MFNKKKLESMYYLVLRYSTSVYSSKQLNQLGHAQEQLIYSYRANTKDKGEVRKFQMETGEKSGKSFLLKQ